MKLADLIKAVNDFFFARQSPTPVALFRIFLGLIVLQDLCVHLAADFKLYYGDYAIVPIESMFTNYWGRNCYFDLMLLLPPGETWRVGFFVVTGILALFMTLGLFTRASSVTLFFCLLSIDSHFEMNQNDGDVFLRLAVMMVAMSSAGEAFSVDNLLRSLRQDWRVTGFRPRLSAPWAQRLLQLQLAFCYWHTFIVKMRGRSWVDGIATYYASRYDDVIRFPVPYFLDSLLTIKLLTWGTLVIEFSLWALIWFRELRYFVILAGLLLHLGIEYSMNLPMFEWLFMFAYLNFVYPEDLSKTMDRIKVNLYERFGEPELIAFNAESIYSVRAVGLLHRLDIFEFVKFIDYRSEQFGVPKSMVYKESPLFYILRDGEWLSGRPLWAYVTSRLPWLIWTAPLYKVPLLASIGDSIGRLVALNQKILFGGTCEGPALQLEEAK